MRSSVGSIVREERQLHRISVHPLLKAVAGLSASVIGALLLYVSFPPWGMAALAWVAFVPLLTVLRLVSISHAFFLSLAMGTLWWGLHIQWVNDVAVFPLTAFVALILFCGLFFGLFGWCFALITQATGWPGVVTAPVLWVALEYLRYNLGALSLPWGLVGHSQHAFVELIQLASVTSVYGVSFLILLVNAAIAEGCLWLASKRRHLGQAPGTRISPLASMIGAGVTVLAVLLWGNHEVSRLADRMQGSLTVSLVQGNVPQIDKWEAAYRKQILELYRGLSAQASQEHPDLIIWPEAATPGYLKQDPLVFQTVKNVLKETGVPLLLGSGSPAKTMREGKKSYRQLNSAFLLDVNGRIVAAYDKMVLLPFAEYLPYEGRFPWPRWLVPDHGSQIPGSRRTLFDLSQGRFGIMICWENLFPNFFRKFVADGAQFMVNLTNEAWFGKSPASRQIMAMSVFRAVENRVALLRCANTGITSLVDPLGRVRARVVDEAGNDLMVTGVLTVVVPQPMGPTFYTANGDVFAGLCNAAAVFFMVTALLPAMVRRFLRISANRVRHE